MYVDRDGKAIETLWIATHHANRQVSAEEWQHLTAVLFYLAWARIPFVSPDRPSGEDFYYEAFSVPVGASPDLGGHTRWSKYANTYWSSLKIYPGPDVSTRRAAISLPTPSTAARWMDFVRDERDLYFSLEAELQHEDSRLLTALWFLQQAAFQSFSRASFAEDIQNLCTAFEALLNIGNRGDSAAQVSSALESLFREQAPTAADELAARDPDPERPEVLGQLRSWVYALYEIRNAYTHGKTALTLEFQSRSIWQDAFEVFRLAANRRILLRPEGRAMDGSKLEKRLMSVQYYDAVVRFLSDRDRWLRSGRKLLPNVEVDEIIRKGRVLDPGLIVSITSLPRLRQALFNICMAVWDTLEHCGRGDCDGRSVGVFLQEFEETYRSCMKPKLDTDAFIRKISPRLGQWVPTPVVANSSTPLFELLKVQQNLLFVYRQSTGAV